MLGAALFKNRTGVQDIRSVAYSQRFANVMVGYQDSDARFLQLSDDLLNVDNRNGVYTRKRLVEQHELRRDDQRAGDFHAPAFSSRQSRAGGVAHMFDAEFLEQSFQPCAPLGGGNL